MMNHRCNYLNFGCIISPIHMKLYQMENSPNLRLLVLGFIIDLKIKRMLCSMKMIMKPLYPIHITMFSILCPNDQPIYHEMNWRGLFPDRCWVFFSFMDNLAFNTSFEGTGLDCVDDGVAAWPGISIFYHQPIYNFIHGIRDPYIDSICPGDPFFDLFRPDTFYRLAANGTNMIVESTGKADLNKTRQLRLYRNNSIPLTADKPVFGRGPLWMDHDEFVEGGRETRQFPPLDRIKKDSKLVVWSIEKFRKTDYVFQKEVTFNGVPLWRFRVDDKELQNCTRYYNNSCSLSPTTPDPTTSPITSSPTVSPTTATPTAPTTEPTPQPTNQPTMEPIEGAPTLEPTTPTLEPTPVPSQPTTDPTPNPTGAPTEDTAPPTMQPTNAPTCLFETGESENCKYYQFWEDGIFNLTNLRGPPSFVSKGRLLDAPYFIENTVRKFNISEPDPDIDDQYFDIDPKSGIVFRNYHSYQLNFQMIRVHRPYPTNWSNITIYDDLIPFAYIRVEGIATDQNMEDYADILDTIDLLKGLSLYGGPAVAVLLFGIMFFLLCQTRRYKKEQDGYGHVDNDPYGRLVENNNDDGGSSPKTEITKTEYGATTDNPPTDNQV
eukprot:463719_1